MTKSRQLVVIVGPTASGKSALAMQVALKHRGQIIAADSRTVYRGMDIGTAKPTAQEQQRVPHHLIDIVDPNEPFTAADFKRLAEGAIDQVAQVGDLPIVVGGTGLYINALLYDYSFAPSANPQLRDELNQLSLQELQKRVEALGIELNRSDWHNPRRLVRAIESQGVARDRKHIRSGIILVGLNPKREMLSQRISKRAHDMVQHGLLDEVRQLEKTYGSNCSAFDAPGYRPFLEVIKGLKSAEQAEEEFIRRDTQLARRQMTWFRRIPEIKWFGDGAEALQYIDQTLTS